MVDSSRRRGHIQIQIQIQKQRKSKPFPSKRRWGRLSSISSGNPTQRSSTAKKQCELGLKDFSMESSERYWPDWKSGRAVSSGLITSGFLTQRRGLTSGVGRKSQKGRSQSMSG